MSLQFDRYDRLQLDMADWIDTQMWGGHEVSCEAYGFKTGACCCIRLITCEWRKLRALKMYEKPITKLAPQLMRLQAENDALKLEIMKLKGESYVPVCPV